MSNVNVECMLIRLAPTRRKLLRKASNTCRFEVDNTDSEPRGADDEIRETLLHLVSATRALLVLCIV